MERGFVVFRKKLFSWIIFGKFSKTEAELTANKLKFVGHLYLTLSCINKK